MDRFLLLAFVKNSLNDHLFLLCVLRIRANMRHIINNILRRHRWIWIGPIIFKHTVDNFLFFLGVIWIWTYMRNITDSFLLRWRHSRWWSIVTILEDFVDYLFLCFWVILRLRRFVVCHWWFNILISVWGFGFRFI